LLAIDIGSSSVRALAFDESATALAGSEERLRYDVQPGGVLDAVSLLASALAVEQEASARLAHHVPTVAISCFWHSLLALDGRNRPLTPVLTWRDVRSAHHARRLADAVDAAAVWARTGAPLHASFWPAKLAWLAEEHPDEFRSAARFVSFPDWLLLEATGELRTSLSMASGTGLWSDGGWDAELLDALGMDGSRLPPVGDDPAGTWYPALGDGAASNLGSGCTTPGRAALNVGTSAALRIVTTEPGPPPPGLFRYRLDERRAVVGGALSVGGNLHAWLDGVLRLPDGAGLADRPPCAHGLTFVPLLAGERSPGWNAEARGAVSGIAFETTALDLLHAGLEGVALELRRVAELLPSAGEIVVSGGALAESPDWVQIVADVLERPLHVSAEHEASARGAAVYVLERLGGAPPAPRVERVVDPRVERAEAYRAAFARQRSLYESVT
jgi:gluconokinase